MGRWGGGTYAWVCVCNWFVRAKLAAHDMRAMQGASVGVLLPSSGPDFGIRTIHGSCEGASDSRQGPWRQAARDNLPCCAAG